MKKLRYGFIGAGTIMRIHAKSLATRDDVELAAVSEPNEKTRAEGADMFNIPGRYAEHRQMLKNENLDVVLVCSPNVHHAAGTIDSLRAGCHVLCEKPPALNVKEALKMKEEADKKSLRLFYGLHMRFSSQAQTARSYYDKGELGEIYHVSAQWFRRRGIPGMGSWFTTRALSGGGAVIDIGVHMFDLVHYLMGLPKPVTVSGATYTPYLSNPQSYRYISMWGMPNLGGVTDVEDLAAFFVRFENGATVAAQVSWAANTRQDNIVRLIGTKGGIMLEGKNIRLLTEHSGFIADIEPQFAEYDVRTMEHEHFIACIRDKNKEMLCDASQGVVLQSVLDAVYRSSTLGKEVPVKIPDMT